MTYPRTPEEKARSLGSRLACEAFNACGSLDAKKCQELGDAFGKAIAELVVGNARERWAGYSPPRLPNQDRIDAAIASLWAPLSPESRAALAAGLESARRGEIQPMGSFAEYAEPTPEPGPCFSRCFVCGKGRDGICGHDTYVGGRRRWYCSRECGARP